MKYLGIDYGSKYIGLALSDDGGNIAFPLTVIPVSKTTIQEIQDIVKDEQIGAVIVGESKNIAGEDNSIMGKIREFTEQLRTVVSLPIYFENEGFTSVESSRQGGSKKDDSAAALILQRYLERK